jgi:hypothetical protein
MAKKNIIIKIWPEIVSYIPATIPYRSINNKTNIGKNILMDFNNCREVNATGLNILLIQILKLMSQKSNHRPWMANPKISTNTIQKIIKLGFFNKLNTYSNISDLFWDDSMNIISKTPIIEYINSSEKIISYPLQSQQIDKLFPDDRRKYLTVLRTWLYDNFFDYSKVYNINIINLISIVTEIVKNTADHTNSDVFFGIDLIENVNNEYLKIFFSIGDLGIGINKNIKNYIFNNNLYVSKNLKESRRHWDLTSTYKWALTCGNSTKLNSKDNKGIGMSSIMTCSKKVPLELSIFDADSRGIISNLTPDSLTHAKVREHFYSIDKPVGFFYYGEIEAERL